MHSFVRCRHLLELNEMTPKICPCYFSVYSFDCLYCFKECFHITSPLPCWCLKTIERLSNGDGDGYRNSKNAIGLHWQNNNFARASCFLYISLPSGLQPQKSLISLFVEEVNTRERLAFFFLNYDTVF